MKVILINPPYDIENYYGKLSELAFVFPPVGLTYLASYIRQFNHEVVIYDFQVEERNFIDYLKKFKPDLVGITCQTAIFYNTLKLAQEIKKIFPKISIIAGGAHATYRPEDFFEEGSPIDIVVKGEGEETILDLISYLQDSSSALEKIKGISFRKGNQVIHNPPRELIKNLDKLPVPAIDLLPLEKYRVSSDNYLGGRVGLISTSRGCSFGCIFCAHKQSFNRTYRARNLENVFSEIKYYIDKYNITELFIIDDCFGLERRRTIEFCQRMVKEGYHKKLLWWCQLRVDLVDAELLRYMKLGGCRIISFGIESGVQRLLDMVSKRVTLNQIKMAIRLAKNAGLEARGSFILGLPTESLRDSFKTIFFSLQLPLSQVKFGLATPYPGTKLWDIALAEGQVKSTGEDWNRFTQMAAYTKYVPPYIPSGRNALELVTLQKLANFIFYLRPSVILTYLKRIKNLNDLFYFLRSWNRFILSSVR